jgi:NAD(P)-dependent dehydrogenase (short-subunit alcohol dehydrogenase family)
VNPVSLWFLGVLRKPTKPRRETTARRGRVVKSSGPSARREPALSDADHAQHTAGRVGTPEDVAALVSFLLGPEGDFVTGANFVVDVGMTRKMMYL